MSTVVLLLGGNEDKTHIAFSRAREMISDSIGKVMAVSSLYRSPPWGFEHPHWFLNQAVVVESDLDTRALLMRSQRIEKELGRKKKTATHYEGRLIDIDILFMNDLIVDHPQLQIPHPRLHLRRFTLLPLSEIMPEYLHPVLEKTIRSLLVECPDDSFVEKVDQSFEP